MADKIKGLAGAMPAIGIGMDIANAVGGWFGGNKRQKQQYNYQRKLNEQMAQIQRDNWDYTNAENQREHYYRDWETDRKSTRLNSSHITRARMPSSA